MTSQPQTVTVHILPNISGSKGNQATKFGLVIEHHNKRGNFLKKSNRK